MTDLAEFRRMVLGLPHSQADYDAVAFAADLANLLGVDLVGLFASDENLAQLASLPCVRELRLSGGWHPIDAGQIERVTERAIAEARRRFTDAAKALRVGARFDVARGQIGEVIGSQSVPSDIIAVIEPKNPAERVTHQFRQLLDAALRARAATLLLPSRIQHRRGPVVAIAASEHDPSIRVARKVAESSHEKVIILMPQAAGDAPSPQSGANNAAAHVERRTIRAGLTDVAELLARLAPARERIVVLSRGADLWLPSKLAFQRAVPVLVTEPD
jgi:hypothetical protein